jgi:hypothetical protein
LHLYQNLSIRRWKKWSLDIKQSITAWKWIGKNMPLKTHSDIRQRHIKHMYVDISSRLSEIWAGWPDEYVKNWTHYLSKLIHNFFPRKQVAQELVLLL